MKKIDVLMLGSAIQVKGGMTTVVKSFLDQKQMNDINIKYIPTHIDSNNIYKILFYLVSVARIILELIIRKPKIVHMHVSENGSFTRKYYIMRVCKIFRRKVIVHTHGAEFKEFFNNSSYNKKKKIKYFLKHSDLVITLGEKWNNIIKSMEPSSNLLIMRNAVGIPKTPTKINKKYYSILFLAVLIKRKGIIDLIDSSKEIVKQLNYKGISIKFVIAGDGEQKTEAINKVKQLNLEENFEFLGWVDDKLKTELLSSSDILVLPSYNEGLPMSILEAMSYGLPIITTNVGSINEAVKDGINGYLINPGDTKSLSNKITYLIENNELELFSRNSRDLALNKFNKDNYFNQFEEIYKRLS